VRREVKDEAEVSDTVDRRRLIVLVGLVLHTAKPEHVSDKGIDSVDLPSKKSQIRRDVLQRAQNVQDVDVEHHTVRLHHGLLIGVRHVGSVDHCVQFLRTIDEDGDQRCTGGGVLKVLDLGRERCSREVVLLDTVRELLHSGRHIVLRKDRVGRSDNGVGGHSEVCENTYRQTANNRYVKLYRFDRKFIFQFFINI